MSSRVVRCFVAAVGCLLLAGSAVAQVTTATLYGIVRDSSGSLLPGATVTLVHEETATSRTATTDAMGEFALSALPVGHYTVKIELQGFKTHETRGLNLTAGQTARQSYSLEVGRLAETVVVEGVAPLLKTASSEQMETIGTLQVAELPLARRNVTGLLRLAPGVDPTGGHRGVRFNGSENMVPASPSTEPTRTPTRKGAASRSTAARTTSTS